MIQPPNRCQEDIIRVAAHPLPQPQIRGCVRLLEYYSLAQVTLLSSISESPLERYAGFVDQSTWAYLEIIKLPMFELLKRQ